MTPVRITRRKFVKSSERSTICPNQAVKSHLPGAADDTQMLLLMAYVL